MNVTRDGLPDLNGASVHDCWNKVGVHGDRSCPQLAEHVHCRNCPIYFAGAVALLDRAVPADYRDEWTSHFAAPKRARELDTHSAVIFRIGTEWLALPNYAVSEVANALIIHSLPHRRNGVVLGLANVRGELVVCVSLAQVLGIESAAPTAEGFHVLHARSLVIHREDARMVCPVDEVHGIYRFQPRELQEAPITILKAATSYSKGILPWSQHSVGLVDDERLFAMLNRSIA